MYLYNKEIFDYSITLNFTVNIYVIHFNQLSDTNDFEVQVKLLGLSVVNDINIIHISSVTNE